MKLYDATFKPHIKHSYALHLVWFLCHSLSKLYSVFNVTCCKAFKKKKTLKIESERNAHCHFCRSIWLPTVADNGDNYANANGATSRPPVHGVSVRDVNRDAPRNVSRRLVRVRTCVEGRWLAMKETHVHICVP